jgi:hypothetical protein
MSKDPETPCLFNHDRLYVLENRLLELPLDLNNVSEIPDVSVAALAYLLTRVILARLAVEAKKSSKIELGCLQELDLSYVNLCHISSAVQPKSNDVHIHSAEGRYPE